MMEALSVIATALWTGAKAVIVAIASIGLFMLWMEHRKQ